MTNHTPGPWNWVKKCDYWQLESATGEEVADDGTAGNEYVGWFSSEDGEPCANARLIAAAPDLLEACELHISALRSQIRDGKQRPEYAELIYQAQKKMMAAIAKARGEA